MNIGLVIHEYTLVFLYSVESLHSYKPFFTEWRQVLPGPTARCIYSRQRLQRWTL